MKLLSPAAVRRCFIADPGHLIFHADYDQIELRIAAGLSGEKVLIDAAKRGESLHKAAAIRLFGEDYTPDQYRLTKNTNFGWLFGAGPNKLAEQAGIPIKTAYEFYVDYEKTFTSLAAYKRQVTNSVLNSALSPLEQKALRSLRSKMYSFRTDTSEGRSARYAIKREIDRMLHRRVGYVLTPFGRRLPVDADKAYAGLNYRIQSSAADVMKQGLLRVMKDPELEPSVLLIIHDELLGQAPIRKAERFAKRYAEVMTTEFMGVPLTATGEVYGKSWGDGYERAA
jgi:DNA polymerase I